MANAGEPGVHPSAVEETDDLHSITGAGAGIQQGLMPLTESDPTTESHVARNFGRSRFG